MYPWYCGFGTIPQYLWVIVVNMVCKMPTLGIPGVNSGSDEVGGQGCTLTADLASKKLLLSCGSMDDVNATLTSSLLSS